MAERRGRLVHADQYRQHLRDLLLEHYENNVAFMDELRTIARRFRAPILFFLDPTNPEFKPAADAIRATNPVLYEGAPNDQLLMHHLYDIGIGQQNAQYYTELAAMLKRWGLTADWCQSNAEWHIAQHVIAGSPLQFVYRGRQTYDVWFTGERPRLTLELPAHMGPPFGERAQARAWLLNEFGRKWDELTEWWEQNAARRVIGHKDWSNLTDEQIASAQPEDLTDYEPMLRRVDTEHQLTEHIRWLYLRICPASPNAAPPSWKQLMDLLDDSGTWDPDNVRKTVTRLARQLSLTIPRATH